MTTTGYKEYSDSYLMSLAKSDIIKQLRCAEHNFKATEQMFDQHMENVKSWEPVRHGHWIFKQRISENCIRYSCSVCNRWVQDGEGKNPVERYPYCHCGARMDEEVQDG